MLASCVSLNQSPGCIQGYALQRLSTLFLMELPWPLACEVTSAFPKCRPRVEYNMAKSAV
jgi:hypothetical protein